ncbi:MAG: polysaccharide biosynthesis protein [Candidatus Izimaplasma sp.]|nr:polysaccharide biosynthesis protein [Candidatus Izimaplasma bacterium]
MTKAYRHLLVLLMDIVLVVISFILALIIMFQFQIGTIPFYKILYEIPFIAIVYFTVFELFGMYKSIWKFASVEEIIRGTIANFVAISISYLVVMVFGLNHYSFAVYIVAFFFAVGGTLGFRMSFRIWQLYTQMMEDGHLKERTLIIGAGNAGVLLYEELKNNADFNKLVVGFIDDDVNLIKKTIRGVPVLGTTDDLYDIAYEEEIDTVILAVPSLNYHETKEILNKAEKTKCKIQLMPPFYEMVGSKDNLLKIRDIKIEDLLGRDPIILDETGLYEYIENKIIVITGGGGSIGSELARQIRHFGPKHIIIVDIYENNAYDLQMEFKRLYRKNHVKHKPKITVLIASVRDEKRMDEIFKQHKPDIVYHAAAHKHVPLMEVSPKEAVKNNVLGTYNTARMAAKHKVEKFVLISTDKAVNPTNIMGATKRMAERIVMALDKEYETDFAAVRFGNVLGSNGSVIPLFKRQIEEGGPVTVTHPEIIRYFMTIPEATQLVIQASAYANGGELFVLDMGEPIKIINLAEKMIRLSGLDPYKDISIEFTGLRPGEKMYEELLVDENEVTRTDNEKIFIEPNDLEDLKQIELEIKDIITNINKPTDKDIVKFMKTCIKSYKKK